MGTHSYKAVFFDGCREDSISLIVYVFPNYVYSAWSTSDEIGLTVV